MPNCNWKRGRWRRNDGRSLANDTQASSKHLKTNITTLDYMKKLFPLLRHPDGFKLVSLKIKTVFQALKNRTMIRNLIINRFSIRFRPKINFFPISVTKFNRIWQNLIEIWQNSIKIWQNMIKIWQNMIKVWQNFIKIWRN